MRPDERVTEFIDDGGSTSRSGGLPRSPSHQSSSSSSTAPPPAMALMSQSMTLPHGSSMRRDNKPHPLIMTGKLNGMSMTMSSSSPKLNNRESELNTHRYLNGLSGETGKSIASPKLHQPFAMSEMLVEPVDDEGEGRTTWEYHSVTLHRVPGFGFGIAVSGGRDNPHFKSGDPSIVVSDVVRSGPAWGQLQVNDRILSANGVSLENAEYQAAVQIMKENEQLNMIVKRRVPLPAIEFEQRTLKFTLTKSRRKDDFGVVLGCKFYIKDITNPKLAEKEPGLKEGDTVLRINGQSLEDVTLADAMKLLERSREKLSMVIQRDVPRGASWKWGSQNTLYERLGSLTETPRESPRASPMLVPRTDRSYSDEHARLNNASRSPARTAPRMAASEYVNTLNVPTNGGGPSLSPQNRHSFGAGQHQQPASRSRTPNHYSQNASLDAEYGNYSVRSLPPTTPPLGPIPFPSTDESLDTNGSGLPPRPPLSAGSVPDVRVVHFRKESGSVGVRVVGGNEVGIFVSAVQTQSPAASKGVRPGDKILKVNGSDMRGVTREEAVLYLLGLQDEVELLLQYRKDEYDRVRAQQLGDNFFIRTHFDHDKPSMQQELTFKHGDIFQIIDTLFGGTVGSWQAIKVYSPSDAAKPEPQQTQVKGVIPNAQTAEKLAALDPFRVNRANGNAEATQSNTLTKAGGAFFRRKMGLGSRRAKSLNKGHWDEVVFGQGNVQFAAYERVKLSTPGFLRPVVLFGPLADVARELLLKDFPLRFASPSADASQKTGDQPMDASTTSTAATPAASQGIVRLSSICEVMGKNKHCLLDVTPSSVEKLQYAQYAPIVVFVDVDSRSRLRDLRAKAGVSSSTSNVSTKKLLDQAARIKKYYSHLLTATLDATKEDQWFEALRELISHLQDRRVWMAETKPVDVAADDFLFPMANSRFTNYDSDGESLKGDYSSDYCAAPQNGQSTQQTTLRDASLNGSVYDEQRMQRSRYDNQRSLERSHSTAAAWNGPHSAGPYPQPHHPNTVYTRYFDDNNGRHNYAGQYGDVPPRPPPIARYRNRLNQQTAPASAYQMTMSQCDPSELYANRDTLVSHFVTMRRPQLLPNGDMKPPRTSHPRAHPPSRPAPGAPPPDPTIVASSLFVQSAEPCAAPPAVPPKPVASMPKTSVSPKKDIQSEAVADPAPKESDEREKSPVAKVAEDDAENAGKVVPSADGNLPAGCPTNETKVDESLLPPHLRTGSYGIQGGYYDIKQILAEQADADLYRDASRATPSPPTYRAALASAGPIDHGQLHSAPLSARSSGYYDQSGGQHRSGEASRPPMPPPATGFTLMNPAYRELDPINPPYATEGSPQRYTQPPSYQSRSEVTRTISAPDPAPRSHLPMRSGARPPPPLNTNGRTHMPPPPAPQPRSPRSVGPMTSSESSASPQPPGVYHLSRLSSQDESTPSPPPMHQVRLASSSPTKGNVSDDTPRNSPSAFKVKPPLPVKPSALNGAGDCPSASAFERYGRASGSEEREGSIATIDGDELDEAQHTVVAHVSGVIDSLGGTLSSEETGVSIYVPPGAIPPGIQQEIYFKVCRDSQMAPPLDPSKGETLLSPLVMCGPQGLRFDKSVELRLPHSASGVNSEQWSFALKSASGAEAEWKQVSLNDAPDGTNKQTGRLDDKFVCVQIDHF